MKRVLVLYENFYCFLSCTSRGTLGQDYFYYQGYKDSTLRENKCFHVKRTQSLVGE